MRFCPLLLVAFLFFRCDSIPNVGPRYSTAKQEDLRARYHQGVCFGRCEVFTLDVYDTGLLVFKGERFTEKPGVWQKNVDRGAARAFLDSLASLNFASLPRSYPSRLPDLATTTVTYFNADGTPYATSFKEDATPGLRRAQDRVRAWATSGGWKQVSEALADGREPTFTNQRQEIIVRLQDGADAGAWLVKYGKQGVTLKKRISPNSPYYVISANPNLMGANELLAYLRNDEQVVSAQLNNSVSER